MVGASGARPPVQEESLHRLLPQSPFLHQALAWLR